MQPLLSFPRSSISRLARPDFDTSGSLSRRMRWTLPQRRRFQPAVLSVPAYRFAQGLLYRAKLNPQFSLALLVVEPRAVALLRHQIERVARLIGAGRLLMPVQISFAAAIAYRTGKGTVHRGEGTSEICSSF